MQRIVSYQGIKETNMPTRKQERTEHKSINNIEWFMP
jgi:hypothetical protein